MNIKPILPATGNLIPKISQNSISSILINKPGNNPQIIEEKMNSSSNPGVINRKEDPIFIQSKRLEFSIVKEPTLRFNERKFDIKSINEIIFSDDHLSSIVGNYNVPVVIKCDSLKFSPEINNSVSNILNIADISELKSLN